MPRNSGGASAATTTTTSPKAHNLFQVYLRLRPAAGASSASERFLNVEAPRADQTAPSDITLNPPNDRRRAIEKFHFTQVFEEDASQLDVFHCTGVVPLIEGVLGSQGGDGTDALVATLGVTGSGKTHTILGSKSQRGLTQLALDVIFRSLSENLVDGSSAINVEASVSASDASEANVLSAQTYLETVFADPTAPLRASSRAPTPQIKATPCHVTESPKSIRVVRRGDDAVRKSCLSSNEDMEAEGRGSPRTPRGRRPVVGKAKSPAKHFMKSTASKRQKIADTPASHVKGESFGHSVQSRRLLNRPSIFPQQPDISSISVMCDPSAEYAVVVSMYEVYNDRIFDLLTPPTKSGATKEVRRRPLLFKSTETSDQKVVAGLRKIVCSNVQQALMVLEAGLHERRVAGTGSNSTSSRSHGFFCVEVKKRPKTGHRRYEVPWGGSTLTIVDLAGSERARDAKTAGATLAEAGKINESLMYLGQCLQMQSDGAGKDKPSVVPFRQCKLTELLFSNSFPSGSSFSTSTRRPPQKGVMIVTADPHGDFNATSQILRYSALAREVTVPRIPSLTQTILAQHTSTNTTTAPLPCSSPIGSPPLHHRPFFPPSSASSSSSYFPMASSPNVTRTYSPRMGAQSPGLDEHRSTMELAALEIARLSEELDYMRQALATEQAAREEAEAHLLSMEDRMLDMEQVIREDCAVEFERRLEIETSRFRANMQLESERGEEHWSRKIEVFERTIATSNGSLESDDVFEGAEDKENVLLEDINQENERLRRDNDVLRRELTMMSPTKRKPLQDRQGSMRDGEEGISPKSIRSRTQAAAVDMGLQQKMSKLKVSDDSLRSTASGSPKKMRKLATKRWDAVDADDFV